MLFQVVRENLTTSVYENRQELGEGAANDAAKIIREAIAERGEARVIFAAAPSQNETLAALVAAPGIDWTKVVAFHMDEYVGLPIGSTARFSHYLKKHCFDLVPFKAIYYIDEQNGADVEAMMKRYEELLNAAPIDLVCMGIGENGHIAFNDPPVADFNDPKTIKLVELDDVCRQQQVHDGCFPNFESTPTHALTLTVSALTSARRHICSVPGALKRDAVRKTLNDPVTTACPATILRKTPFARMYVDKDCYGEE